MSDEKRPSDDDDYREAASPGADSDSDTTRNSGSPKIEEKIIEIETCNDPEATTTSEQQQQQQQAEPAGSDRSGNKQFSAKRMIGNVINSAVQRMQGFECEDADGALQAGMIGNVGHIKLRPDPATTLNVAGSRAAKEIEGGELEQADMQPSRPGLLSHYLQLMNIDRKRSSRPPSRPAADSGVNTKNKERRRAQQLTEQQKRSQQGRVRWSNSHTPEEQSAEEHDGRGALWLDIDNRQASSTPGVFSGLRRRNTSRAYQRRSIQAWRRSVQNRASGSPNAELDGYNDGLRASSGFFSALGQRFRQTNSRGASRSNLGSPEVTTPLASNPGGPFRHLSEALPWATSHRQMASACGTPLVQTRRPSLSSLAGDVSTVPRMTIDNAPIDETLSALHMLQSHPESQRQNIVQAIDMLLLHQRFLVLVSKAMMMYGSPLHHLEDNLKRTAQLLDLEMTASAIPGLVLLSFDDSVTHTSETKLIRCSNGWDMHRLDQTNQLLRRVVHGKTEVKEAVLELESIMTAPPIYAWYWQVLNWGVISWSLCLVCFGGSWEDSGISLALGLVAGIMSMAAGKFSGYTNFFEVSVSILAGILSAALANWGCFGATALSATVVLLPGLVMTTGVIELSSRHMIAGTVRIFYALLLAFIIAYGLLIGVEIYNKMAGRPVLDGSLLDLTQCQGLTKWSWFGTFPVGIISISVLVNIHWRHWASVTLVAGVCYGIFWLFKFHLELDDLAPVVASFALGMVANLWSRFTGQTAYMILLPGEMFLVPGSVGVRGFSSLLSKEGGQGVQLALQMITTCLSIMMGLFASSFVIYPQGKKHSALLTV
ncbi:pheromone-regulated protein prm10 [Coemansia sp. RSA 486]|nr:pheromone-regulated protein prm10 [Coemansia sp. RSA 486]